jgi:pSer/pThr/pTyr-binding forkhead associated (FHA) protein
MPQRILVVTREGRASVHPLPDGQTLLVGRAPDCQIRIPDLSVSRRHALVHVGERVEVEDLGSQNRTRVRGTLLKRGARVELRAGEAVEFGAVSAVVQDVDAPMRQSAGFLAGKPTEPLRAEDVLVLDERMRELYRMVDQVAPSSIHVLLLGETGVGKDVLAETLHRRSPRAGKPFMRLNCASFTEALLESELFGHERGAFTGAVREKQVLLEVAEAGTVFLDEVGELPAALQAKLLHVLETREVRRVGGTTTRRLECRFVSATNRDLQGEVAAGASAPTSTTASPVSRSPCRRCASAWRRSSRSCAASSPTVAAEKAARPCSAFPPTRPRACAPTRGRATSASCATSWSARSRSAPAR